MVVHPLHALGLDVRVEHGVVVGQWLQRHGQVEVADGEASVSQQGEPRVPDGRLRRGQLLLLAADVVEGKEQVVVVVESRRQLLLHFLVEVRVPTKHTSCQSVDAFNARLKTHYFKLAFNVY